MTDQNEMPIEIYAEFRVDGSPYSHPWTADKDSGLTKYIRADALREVRDVFNAGWECWFGDEDPNGDRENGYFIPFDDFEKLQGALRKLDELMGEGE